MSLISIEATWQYQSTSNTVPPDPYSVTVPPLGWTIGLSPFGTGNAPTTVLAANSPWDKNTGLWIRRFVVCDGEKEILVKGNIEQAMFLFWNGDFIGSLNPNNDSREDVPEYRIIIDRSLATDGTHELAILCLDDSGVTGTDFTYVSIEADYLPVVFPFQPKAPVSEKLSWFTDVAISRNGTEERKKLMASPRQEFKYTYPIQYMNHPMAKNIVWGDLASEILVPIWTQAVRVFSVSSGLNTISLNTSFSEFRAPGFAILWKSSDDWQIIGIYEKDSTSITFSNLSREFSSCWIIPVRTGVLSRGATKVTNGLDSFFELEFMIRDNLEVVGAEPYQYLLEDSYLEETLLSGDSISEDLRIDLEIFDPGLAKFSFKTGLERTRTYREYRVLCEDVASSWALREFVNRRSGRYRQFYQPTFENDLRVVNTSLIVNTLQVKKDGYLRNSQSRTKIAIETSSGWSLREIIAVSSLDSETMSLQVDIDLNISPSDIRRVCWLGLKRLDTDVIEIDHIGAGVSQSSFMVVEIG